MTNSVTRTQPDATKRLQTFTIFNLWFSILAIATLFYIKQSSNSCYNKKYTLKIMVHKSTIWFKFNQNHRVKCRLTWIRGWQPLYACCSVICIIFDGWQSDRITYCYTIPWGMPWLYKFRIWCKYTTMYYVKYDVLIIMYIPRLFADVVFFATYSDIDPISVSSCSYCSTCVSISGFEQYIV